LDAIAVDIRLAPISAQGNDLGQAAEPDTL